MAGSGGGGASPSTPSSELSRISADLISQDHEIKELRKELDSVNTSFASFRTDYSQLLTLYNDTNDELQKLLHERSVEGASVQEIAENVELRELCRTLEVEKEKYREMYLAALEESSAHPALVTTHHAPSENDELKEQIRDMTDHIQELEVCRDDLAARLQHQVFEQQEAAEEVARARVELETLEGEHAEARDTTQYYQEQLAVKNSVIEKLREEFGEMGDENSRLKEELKKREERKESQEELVTTAAANQEDLTRDYKALQLRCSETEKREQEALVYIKDCLKLVEQTQHEKEQLLMQAAQSDTMRVEMEGNLASLVEEASRRTAEEVERVRSEGNRNMETLLLDCGHYQERVAELEAEMEELRVEERRSPIRGTNDAVALADKDAVIYKLREYVSNLEVDKNNLTDQLLEVTNTLRASKEHFQGKILRLESSLKNTKSKLERAGAEKEGLIGNLTESKNVELKMAEQQKQLKARMLQLRSELGSAGERHAAELREVEEREEERRAELKRAHSRTVEGLRGSLLQKQNEASELRERLDSYSHQNNSVEVQLNGTISELTRKLKEKGRLHKTTLAEAEKLREKVQSEQEGRFKAESRLRAVDMQLTSANTQVEAVTENEAKLCSKIKELQLRLDELEFDQNRSRTAGGAGGLVLNHSSLTNLQPPPPFSTQRQKKHRSGDGGRHRRDRKEKEEIRRVFGRSGSGRKQERLPVASTPRSERSDEVTIKFTDHHTEGEEEGELSRIRTDLSKQLGSDVT